jgi:polyhydroxyalkanoate synthesis regulator phasin
MLDTVRTLLLAGVGAIDLTDEKVRSLTDDLVRRGQLAADEAREFASSWAKGAAERDRALDARLRVAVEEALARYNVASHAVVADVERRLTILEDAIAGMVRAAGDRA